MEETTRRQLLINHGLEILGPLKPGYDTILTEQALGFIADLHQRFELRRKKLLLAREERQILIDGGNLPNFLAETKHVREVRKIFAAFLS